MTRALAIALAATLALGISGAEAAKPKKHYAYEGGHFVGGKGSSHYTKHKRG